ncbi:MAG: site-2 protease family protein [Anaerolineales bacterium]|nr:site-2 protease family protein [Anaerolineales bacterium]
MNSLKILTVRGIDIRLHPTFPLILLWAGLQFGLAGGSWASAVFGVLAVTALFVLVTLHELGHSFAAQHYGVPVKQIVLTPIGGVAQLDHIPEKPIQEFVIAIAGPAVNFMIAIMMGMAVWGFGIEISNPLFALSIGGLSWAALFSYVFVYNIFLALFNLLPAFPMDGGRVLRALLAMRLDYVRATDIAAAIGRGLAVLMGIYGLFSGGIFLVLIAVFIFTGAAQEAHMVRLRGTLRGYRVHQAFSPSVYRLTPYSNLQQAVNLMLSSGQSNFPVCQGDELVGFVSQPQLMMALRTRGPHTWVNMIMQRNVQPVSPLADLYEVQQRLDREGVDALPVVSGDGRFLGIITRQNMNDLRRLVTVAPNSLPKVQSA